MKRYANERFNSRNRRNRNSDDDYYDDEEGYSDRDYDSRRAELNSQGRNSLLITYKYPLSISAIILVLLAIFVWPTQWKYTEQIEERANASGSYKSVTPVRINRFTGKTQKLSISSSRWVDEKILKRISENEFEKIHSLNGSNEIATEGRSRYYDIGLYNGTNHRLSIITFQVTAIGKSGGILWERNYEESVSGASQSEFSADIRISENSNIKGIKWEIVEVWGF